MFAELLFGHGLCTGAYLIQCMPGIILSDFERPEMDLNLQSVFFSVSGRYSPRVLADASSPIFELTGMNDLLGAVNNFEFRLRHVLSVHFCTRGIQFPGLVFEIEA